ncbi:hypothetical protein C8R46DRAFT_1307063 [Mycena filopes]|nr:hypothetical protein C8R46DRAFT_1307063 [Mycena filopes]
MSQSFAPLSRPAQSQVKLDPTPNKPQTDGFNYPTFRLLNKQSRVTLSPDFLAPSNVRRVLTTSNANGGWFAATTSAALIVSPLSELRDALKNGTEGVFVPKRTLTCNPVSIAFACNDTRLLAGTEQGQILVFDTAQLRSSATETNPIQVLQGSSSPASQILPNPSNENDLAQLVAIVRLDGTVQMLDMQMESKGAWAGTDFESTPVAASWSPKGKQLAIGLRAGDILTFGLTNNALPLKHLPPTANSPLVSLHWVGPAFTFRTSYGSNPRDPAHHIVSLDPRSNTAAFVQLTHPFPLADRPQNSQVLVLPRWDQDSTPAEEAKTLVVVGDTSSTDLEVLANAGSSLVPAVAGEPFDDLTDELPIMYAYLNDGTVQGWYITHPDSKPYLGLVGATPQPAASPFSQPATASAFGQPSGFGQASTSAFGRPQATSAFGQSQTTPPFGQSAFAQQPAFGQSSFGAQPSAPSVFGSSNTPATTSPFGSSTGGGFGAFASTPSAFGVSNNPPVAPPLNSTPSISMGEGTSSGFGGLSLGSSNSESDGKPKAVGGGMFGSSPSPLPLPPNHPANQPSTSTPSAFSDPSLVKPASGFGAFGSVGSGAFGSPSKTNGSFGGGGAFSGGVFGGGNSSGAQPTTPSNSASPAFGKSSFGQPGFGQTGFGQTGTGQKSAAFGQPGFGAGSSSPAAPSSGGGFSAFASSGPTGFANTAPTSAFGNTAASPAAPTTSPSAGGFSAFSAAKPSVFGQPTSGSVFGANSGSSFGGSGASTSPSPASAFGGGSGSLSPSPASPFGGGGGSQNAVASAFAGFAASTNSAFGNMTTQSSSSSNPVASAFAGFGTPVNSAFGNKTPQPSPAAQPNSASSSPDSAKDRGSPSPQDSPPPAPAPLSFTTTTSPPPNSGAFGNLKSASSGFKPASGFGAFGGDSTPSSSPFFNAASQVKAPPVSAFGNTSLQSTPTPTPAAGKPAFGAPSVLGGAKSAFAPISPASTPTKTPTAASGGFSAFGGSPVSLTSSTTPAKSFGELLKAKDETPKPQPVSVFGALAQSKLESLSPSPSPVSASIKPIQVFTAPPKNPDTPIKESGVSAAGEPVPVSSGSSGTLSQASSFVEVSVAEVEDDADGEEEGEDYEDDDGESFLSESFGSGSEAPPDDDDGEDDSRSPSPSAVPLPPSRSPSSTPRAETPKIEITQSPEDEESDEESDSSTGSRLSTIREESATPPGSPEKKERSPQHTPQQTPLAAPVPVAPSPFGIGLGRPSTRPARSSPLAATSSSGDEDDKEKTVKVEKGFLKPRPASPKPTFGAMSTPVKTESIEENAAPAAKPTRPKTPPLSSLSFGFSSAPKAPLNTGKIPLAGASLPPFSTPSKSPVTPGPSSTTPTSSPGGFFGFNTPKNAMSPAATPGSTPKGFASSFQSPAPSPAPSPMAPPPEVTMEEGMQKECALLFANMTRELEDFRSLAQAANQKRLELSKSAGGSRRAVDLSNRKKWALVDAGQFGQTMRLYEQDLAELKEVNAQRAKSLREFQSNLLKAGTRREEIGRFLKAQHDNDFAKMLKARTLGPEHLETQTQLRRSIRTMQDRIQKLESHLQESKKRLSRANSGNPGLRAPTLDTLNRTFRNMDIALDNQTSDVEKLTARVAKLNMKTGSRNGHATSTRDARLPDPISRQRPFNVTPHIAVTTAAALNAERSAHKLKRALLSVRKEPLLNTQAASAPPAPVAFNTPKSAFGTGLGLGVPVTPLRGLSFGSSPSPSPMPGFDFPEDNFNPSPPPPARRGAGGGGKTRMSNSVPLKRTGIPSATPSPPPSFDWGPLPNFQKKATPISPENSLSGSWVAEGFKK